MNKKGNDRTSRGYCGWHVTWEKNRVYLRSRLEYVVASWLDYKKYKYKVESFIYDGYKPDFFIYLNNSLKYIIEVKYSQKEADVYFKKHKEYFKKKNIKYIVFNKKHINRLERKYNLSDKVSMWINNSANIIHDMRDNKNPHHGMKQSEETKKLIGQKCVERFKDKEYLERFKKAIKKTMTPERRKQMSENAIIRFQERPELKEIIRKANTKYDRNRKIIYCRNCNKQFEVYKCTQNGIFKFYLSTNHWGKIKSVFCSASCANIYYRREKRKVKIKRQIELYSDFLLEYNKRPLRKEFYQYCKRHNVSGDIRSSFGTFKKFMEVVD